MLIVGAYAAYWRFFVFLIGAAALSLAVMTKTDFGVFPYAFILFSGLAMSDKNKRVGGDIRQAIVNPDKMISAGVRATSSVLAASSMLLLMVGLFGFASAASQVFSVLSPFLDLNISFLLILLSTVAMFFLESVALRYGWFRDRR